MADSDASWGYVAPLDDEYPSWSIQFQAFLVFHDLWDVVQNGVDAAPELAAENAAADGAVAATAAAAAHAELVRRDRRAHAAILLGVKQRHRGTVSAAKTARAAWLALEAVGLRTARARRQRLNRELGFLERGAAESALSYARRAKALAEDLVAVGELEKVANMMAIFQALDGVAVDHEGLAEALHFDLDSLTWDRFLAAVERAETMNEMRAARRGGGGAPREGGSSGGRRSPRGAKSIVNNEMLSPYSSHVAQRVPLST